MEDKKELMTDMISISLLYFNFVSIRKKIYVERNHMRVSEIEFSRESVS